MDNVILIDYDNLSKNDKVKGLEFVVDKILAKIEISIISGLHLDFRFYGGWFELDRLTSSAMNLMVEVSKLSPPLLKSLNDGTKVIVRIELAQSLIAAPAKKLFHTFRKRPMPSGLVCQDPHSHPLCNKTSCPAKVMQQFLKRDKCEDCESVRPKDILSKSEQKLVDTMLTADLLFLANNTKPIIIVSSDDDFWPGILTALSMNIRVVQIHTKAGKSTNLFYTQTATENYIEKNIDL